MPFFASSLTLTSDQRLLHATAAAPAWPRLRGGLSRVRPVVPEARAPPSRGGAGPRGAERSWAGLGAERSGAPGGVRAECVMSKHVFLTGPPGNGGGGARGAGQGRRCGRVDAVGYGLAWPGLAWLGSARPGLAWLSPAPSGPALGGAGGPLRRLEPGEGAAAGPALRGSPGSASSCSWARLCPRFRGPEGLPSPRVEISAVALISLLLIKCHFTSLSSPPRHALFQALLLCPWLCPGVQCWGKKTPTSWSTNPASI